MIDGGLKWNIWTRALDASGGNFSAIIRHGQVLHVRRLASGLYRAVRCRGTGTVCE